VPAPDVSRSPSGDASRRERGGGIGWIVLIATVITIPLLVVCCGVIGVVALSQRGIQPAYRTSREAALRAQCSNNMRQIGLAIMNYEQRYKCYPPAFIADKNGKPLHSWRVLILPELGEDALYKQYRFDEPWDSPHNSTLTMQMPRIYSCPSDGTIGGPTTGYAMLVGPHAFSIGPKGRKLAEIAKANGLSNTIMLAEAADAGINWLEPRDLNTKDMQFQINSLSNQNANAGSNDISCHHVGGVNVIMCDGSMQFLCDGIDAKRLQAMITADGGQKPQRPK
jgi:hypothetical protein